RPPPRSGEGEPGRRGAPSSPPLRFGEGAGGRGPRTGSEMLALTHPPSPNLESGQRTHVARVPLDHALAVRQHAAYCQMLRDCGATVRTLDVNRGLPDSTFIEDTAVVLDEVAVLASMGTPERRGETAGIEAELRNYRPLHRIELPATLEGGDVL